MREKTTRKMSAIKQPPAMIYSERIKSLRTSLGINQEQFAEQLGVVKSLVGAAESLNKDAEKDKPSINLLVLLGKLAAEKNLYNDAIWFWEKAGVDMEVLQKIADKLREGSAVPDTGNVLVPSLDSSEPLAFPASLIGHQSSIRFLHLRKGKPFRKGDFHFDEQMLDAASKPFDAGDIVLIDPLETDLRKLVDAFIVVAIRGTDFVGSVTKTHAGVNQIFFTLIASGSLSRGLYIGDAEGAAPVRMFDDGVVLGRIVAHVSRTKMKK